MASHIETVRRIMKGDFAEATDEEKVQAVDDVKKACATAAAAVAIQPVPLLDVALLSPIQIVMVQAIGQVHGYKLNKRSVLEVLSTFGTSILAQNAVLSAAKFVPFAGWLVSVSMAFALTYAIGEVADYYFRTGRGASPAELKSMFKKVYKEKRAEKQQAHSSDGTLKDKIKQLNEAFEAGLLTQEEFDKKKEDLLASF
ncbi:MAG: DUF697 domain-containing protein [Deltaproteobacteria bacterium]|nr:DUF697 domain-containing protein [Deltaproteobacteria bacterium]